MQSTEAFETATRKATKGHRDWLVWSDRGGWKVAPYSAEAIKRALLAVGTAGRFFGISARGEKLRYGWKVGLIMFRNARMGF